MKLTQNTKNTMFIVLFSLGLAVVTDIALASKLEDQSKSVEQKELNSNSY
jgi:hypothetical protein